METTKFENQKLQNLTNIMKAVINDGGKYAGAVITAKVSQTMKPKKDGCPYGQNDITKICKYTVGINGNYTNAVNAQRTRENKEANHVSKPAWFVKLFDDFNGSIVAKRSEMETNQPLSEVYLFFVCHAAETTEYFINDKPATEAEVKSIKMWCADRTESAKESQGLDKPIIVNTVKFSGITEVRANNMKLQF